MDSRFHKLDSGFQSAGFWIPASIFSRISDSGFPYIGRQHNRLIFGRLENKLPVTINIYKAYKPGDFVENSFGRQFHGCQKFRRFWKYPIAFFSSPIFAVSIKSKLRVPFCCL